MPILIVALLVPLSARAQFRGLIEHMISTAKKLEQLQGPNPACNNCTAMEIKEATDAQQDCLQFLCPGGTDLLNKRIAQASAESLKRDFEPEISPEIQPFMTHIYGAYRTELQKERLEKDFLLKALESETKVVDRDAIRLMRYNQAFSYMGLVATGKNGTIDEAETEKAFDQYDVNKQDREDARYIFIQRQHYSKQAPPLFKEPVSQLRQKYTDRQLQEQIEKLIRDLDAKENRAAQVLQTDRAILFSSEESRQVMYAQLRNGPLTDDLLDSFSLQHMIATITDQHFLSGKFAPEAQPTPPDLEKFKPGLKEALRKRIAELDEFLRQPYLDALKTRAGELWAKRFDECYTALVMGREFLPNAKQVTEFLPKEKAIRSEFANAVSKRMSENSAKHLVPIIKAWRMKPPQSYEEFVAEFANGVEGEIRDSQGSVRRVQLPRASKAAQFGLASIWLKEPAAGIEPEYGGNLKRFCKKRIPELLADGAILGTDRFQTGPLTVTDPKNTRGTLYHEYAHLLSGQIQRDRKISAETRKWYEGVFKCGEDAPTETDHGEENWADSISGLASGVGFDLCELINSDTASFTLRNLNPDDKEHASHLFRALRFEVLKKGKVPDTCTKALKFKGETPFVKDCLNDAPQARPSLK
ncbi:MAG: hypothetical protein AB7G93_05585 [Bdellovibrionales bacterium]